MAFFPCYPLNEPAERSQNRSRFTSEVTKHSYEVPSNSSQTVATITFYFNPEDFNEGPFGESQSERQPYLAGSQNRMAQGSTGVQPNSGVEGEFAAFRSSGTPPCNFGFSTKYRDNETGLNYYGYRYYSSGLGRWLGRDPIGIRGGKNLYGMVKNNPIKRVDPIGLCSWVHVGDIKIRVCSGFSQATEHTAEVWGCYDCKDFLLKSENRNEKNNTYFDLRCAFRPKYDPKETDPNKFKPDSQLHLDNEGNPIPGRPIITPTTNNQQTTYDTPDAQMLNSTPMYNNQETTYDTP